MKEKKKRNRFNKNIEALKSNFSNTNINDIENLKEELTTIRKNKMQGILVRSRAQLIEDDEKPTNFFCNLEKHNYASKIIPKLEKNDGKIITDQFEILNDLIVSNELLVKSIVSRTEIYLCLTELSALHSAIKWPLSSDPAEQSRHILYQHHS